MIPFTTCLRLNRKRNKESRDEEAISSTADEHLSAESSASSSTPGRPGDTSDDRREVLQSLEARRCAWRLMEERMAEPGAKKLVSSPLLGEVHPQQPTATSTTTMTGSSAILARGK